MIKLHAMIQLLVFTSAAHAYARKHVRLHAHIYVRIIQTHKTSFKCISINARTIANADMNSHTHALSRTYRKRMRTQIHAHKHAHAYTRITFALKYKKTVTLT